MEKIKKTLWLTTVILLAIVTALFFIGMVFIFIGEIAAGIMALFGFVLSCIAMILTILSKKTPKLLIIGIIIIFISYIMVNYCSYIPKNYNEDFYIGYRIDMSGIDLYYVLMPLLIALSVVSFAIQGKSKEAIAKQENNREKFEKLKKTKELLDEGILTEEEYAMEKEKIMKI